MPWNLFEGDERKRIAARFGSVGSLSSLHMLIHLRRQQLLGKTTGPERDMPAQDHRTIIAGEANRRDLPCQSIGIKLSRTRNVHRTIANVNAVLGQFGKFAEEFVAHRNGMMLLARRTRYLPGDFDVGAIA